MESDKWLPVLCVGRLIKEFAAVMVRRHLFSVAAAFIKGWRGQRAGGQLSYSQTHYNLTTPIRKHSQTCNYGFHGCCSETSGSFAKVFTPLGMKAHSGSMTLPSLALWNIRNANLMWLRRPTHLSLHYPVTGDSPEHVYPYDRSYVCPIREWWRGKTCWVGLKSLQGRLTASGESQRWFSSYCEQRGEKQRQGG